MIKSDLLRVDVKNLSKSFNISYKQDKSALSKVISLLTGRNMEKKLDVLKNISFSAKEGEVLGIIGGNGCGKSTLLSLIAGIYIPDNGEIKTRGKVIYVPGLGQGLQQKLTMRENIFLMGSLMGMSQKSISKNFDAIVEFSGLRDFLDTKVLQFSSGMISRLNFSITIHCIEHHNPEILLLDEVFGSSADISFQDKAIAKMEELIKKGSTVLLVSHNNVIIEKYCDRVILIEKGNIVKSGKPSEVVQNYISSSSK